MKKEFSTLLQFVIIAGLCVGFFYIALPVKYPEISVEALETEMVGVLFWIYSFTGLSAIRFGVSYAANLRQASIDTNKSPVIFLFNEIIKTSQYFLIAITSVFFAGFFFLSYICKPGFSYDLISLWFNVWYSSFIWLPAFVVLSLVRLGIVCLYQYFRK